MQRREAKRTNEEGTSTSLGSLSVFASECWLLLPAVGLLSHSTCMQ